MASLILLSVDRARLSVAPGASVELQVTIQNLTTLLDQVAISVEGVEPGWVEVIPARVPVFAQGSSTARVIFHPPAAPAQALAGVYPLRLVGVAQENAGQQGEARAELEVQLVGDYRLALESAGPPAGQQASYTLRVQNEANATLQVRFSGSDSAGALWYKFDPFQADVPAGAQATATLTTRVKQAGAVQRPIAFTAGAQGEFVLQGGARVAAPAHEVAAQVVPGAPPRLKLALRPAGGAEPERAEYMIHLENPGSLPLAVILSAADAQGLLQFQITPTQVNLPAGGAGDARLSVHSISAAPPAGQRTIPFRVTARPSAAGVAAEYADAAFIQAGVAARPAFPWWVVVAALAIIAIVLALIAIYLLRMGG
jgi:hypothetical protein